MINPFRFLGLALLFAAAVYAVAVYVPDGDPFTSLPNNRLSSLDGLPLPVFAELKARHVRREPLYDIGLFGNSRSLDVGTRHLSLGGCRFFNFSVPSESFRFTVANLERLHEIGKAPRLALISIDHFELQRYNNPISFFAATRWEKAKNDILAGLGRDDIGVEDLLRMGWRHAWIEVRRLGMTFNPESFFSGFVNLFSDGRSFQRVAPPATGYFSDGSRNSPIPVATNEFRTLLKPTSSQIQAGYFKFDMERLARLQTRGTRMVIYESPVEPKSAAAFHARPSPQAMGARSAFTSACASLGVKCYTAPPRLSGENVVWTDPTHPPADILGAYLNGLLDKNRLACPR